MAVKTPAIHSHKPVSAGAAARATQPPPGDKCTNGNRMWSVELLRMPHVVTAKFLTGIFAAQLLRRCYFLAAIIRAAASTSHRQTHPAAVYLSQQQQRGRPAKSVPAKS